LGEKCECRLTGNPNESLQEKCKNPNTNEICSNEYAEYDQNKLKQ